MSAMGKDADPKFWVSYLVGGRDLGWAKEFMEDCASRIRNRVQITTDGHKAYLEAVEHAFGADIDYAQLQKILRCCVPRLFHRQCIFRSVAKVTRNV
jgi:hypothetical protein